MMRLTLLRDVHPQDKLFIENAFFAIGKVKSCFYDTLSPAVKGIDSVIYEMFGATPSSKDEPTLQRLISAIEFGDVVLINTFDQPIAPVFKRAAAPSLSSAGFQAPSPGTSVPVNKGSFKSLKHDFVWAQHANLLEIGKEDAPVKDDDDEEPPIEEVREQPRPAPAKAPKKPPPEKEITYVLHSVFAREQLYMFATEFAELPFCAMMAMTFGTDIPVEAYSQLYKNASDKTLAELEIEVKKGSIDGKKGAYDASAQKVLVSEDLVKSAIENNQDRALLIALLVEEYGHYLDNYLRNELSTVGGDAKNDEGAKFAYRLIDSSLFSAKLIKFAKVESEPYTGDLGLDNRNIADALAAVDAKEQESDDKHDHKEYFGAGTGDDKNPASYGHRSIEFVLSNFGFSSTADLPRIYFGNWLRDFSQIVDPAIVRPTAEALKKLQKEGVSIPELDTFRLSREALTKIVSQLALADFIQFGEEIGRECRDRVTPERLGVYRAEEHIDNPYSEKNGEVDNSLIDTSFARPYIIEQVGIDADTGLKNYINTPIDGQRFDTAVQYMSKQLQLAMKLGKGKTGGKDSGGLMHFGQALHVLEDYFSHSNFVEVSLAKLGRAQKLATANLNTKAQAVLPVVEGFTSSKRVPIVTGRFGQTDVLASIGPKIADLFKHKPDDYEKAVPGKRTPTDNLIMVVLEDLAKAQTSDTSKKGTNYLGVDYVQQLANYKTFLGYRDELIRNKNKYGNEAIYKALHYTGQAIGVVAEFAIHHLLDTVAHLIDDAQTIIDGVGENPTHSQLAKDHDDHHFHELAALCAIDAVALVGQAMSKYWDGDKSFDPVKTAESLIKHPDFIDTFDATIIKWANANEEKIHRGSFKSDIHKAHADGKSALENFKDNVNKSLDKANKELGKFYLDAYRFFGGDK